VTRPQSESSAPPPESAPARAFTAVSPPTDPVAEQQLAWTGDAVLALFARQHVLARLGRIDTPAFLELTSNGFLSCLGRPTRIEAEIGLVYEREGLAAAFAYIEARLIPTWRTQQSRRARQRSAR
jgi:hypothetical protein